VMEQGTRTPHKSVQGGGGGPLIRELEARHDLTEPGLQCRPGNVVTRWNDETKQWERVAIDPDWWYPLPSDDDTRRLAIQLCGHCPARERCLEVGKETARHYGPAGVWGGVWFGEAEGSRKRRAG
jgi:Transcription factor WhiB